MRGKWLHRCFWFHNICQFLDWFRCVKLDFSLKSIRCHLYFLLSSIVSTWNFYLLSFFLLYENPLSKSILFSLTFYKNSQHRQAPLNTPIRHSASPALHNRTVGFFHPVLGLTAHTPQPAHTWVASVEYRQWGLAELAKLRFALILVLFFLY